MLWEGTKDKNIKNDTPHGSYLFNLLSLQKQINRDLLQVCYIGLSCFESNNTGTPRI